MNIVYFNDLVKYLMAARQNVLVISSATLFEKENLHELWNNFHDMHEQRFGFNILGQVIEVVTIAVTGIHKKERFIRI